MSADPVELLRQGQAYKEEGNVHFKAGGYKKALGAYHKVFCYVTGLQEPVGDGPSSKPDGSASSSRVPKDKVQELRQLKQSTKLNMAACYLKLGEHQKCVDACSNALSIGESGKAHFRRGQAYMELRNFSGAQADLERASQLSPEDPAVHQELRKLKSIVKRGDEQERKRCAKMLGEHKAQASEPAEARSADAGSHGQEHGHERGHENSHEPGHGHGHNDGHGQGQGHEQGHKQGCEHSHGECNGHDHGSEQGKAHGHGHEQGHDHNHSECQGHGHEEGEAHGQGHGHGQVAAAEPAAAPEPAGSQPPAAASSSSGTLVQPTTTEALDEAGKPEVSVRELTYAWQQSEDDVKIYVPFDQSEELQKGVDESRVKVEFGEWSVLLVIQGDAGKSPMGLRLGDFHRRIAPERCSCTVRSSRITLKLVKQAKERWWNLLQRAPLHAD